MKLPLGIAIGALLGAYLARSQYVALAFRLLTEPVVHRV